MQYYVPPEPGQFVGDCMPFYHDGMFRLYYLLDEGHHAALGGLGGHQWAHASSPDLRRWTHHPLAIAITAPWEGSICTGSVLLHAGTYYGFYATRRPDYTQHLSLATSDDGIRFSKVQPNPLASPPPGYEPHAYRDPCAFQDPETGLFHLLVTAELLDPPVPGRGGCLAHLESADLEHWQAREPLLIPGLPGQPECPDWFFWDGWYYLLFSHSGVAHYRVSDRPLVPRRCPPCDTFEGDTTRVMKTAAFGPRRRIGVAWLGTRAGDRNDGHFQFGGSAVFRELLQRPDGTLAVRWPPEMAPAATHVPLEPGKGNAARLECLTPGAAADGSRLRLAGEPGLTAARLATVPRDARLSCRVRWERGSGTFGLRLRCGASFDSGCELSVSAAQQSMRLGQAVVHAVREAAGAMQLEVVQSGSIIDVCTSGGHCLVDRWPQSAGDAVFFFAQDAAVVFENVRIEPLQPSNRAGTPWPTHA